MLNQPIPDPRAMSLTIPTIEQLPLLTLDPDVLDENHIVGFNGRDVRSRAFNLLRSQFVKRLNTNNWRMIGVTSASPAAGKSFTSMNLAAALSRLPDRVVYLFDLDLRRGSLAEAIGLKAEYGLGEFLEGDVHDLRQVGWRLSAGNLALFPCFPNMVNSSELLAGDRFEALMAGMASLPDNAIILCDLPPAFANDDTIMVAQQLDAYLMIVEQGVTTAKQVRETRALLDPTPCLGAVLNRYEGGFNDPYGYGYGYGSAYGKYYGS